MSLGKSLEEYNAHVKVTAEGVPRSQWPKFLAIKKTVRGSFTQTDTQKEFGTETTHRTSPAVWEGCGADRKFVGGYDTFSAKAKIRHKWQ